MDHPSSTHFPYHHHPSYDYPRSQGPLYTAQLSQSPVMEYPSAGYSEHEARFDVELKVKRSFSFEELQSGSYFASLDEFDLQFYRRYGQPVLIPSPDEADGNFVLHNHVGVHPGSDQSCMDCANSTLHFDSSVMSSKSYTLQNPLGECGTRTSGQTNYVPPQANTPDWQRVKQEVSEETSVMAYSSDSLTAVPYSVHGHENSRVSSITSPPATSYDDPPMDSLPFPPPANVASPPYFHLPQPPTPSQDSVALGSPSFMHEGLYQIRTGHEHWEDMSARTPRLTVPSQSYMLRELPSSASPTFPQTHSQQYTSSFKHSHSRHSRSPSSPRSPTRMSPVPHAKRTLDKKPALACLFCRGRKIACGPPQPGSKDKTCNQCARRHLKCEYPLESRRGMRKRRSLIPRASSAAPEINPDGPKVKTSRKRSVGKSS